jgi:23S rRNA (cytosine1962-C5)-methyltransferase
MYVTEKILRALDKRTSLRRDATTAYRVVDGSGDELPGLVIDNFNDAWLVGFKPGQAIPELDPTLGFRSLYGKLLADQKRKPPTFWAGEPVANRFTVKEYGLNFWIDFQSGYSQGLFLDQRLNRRRLRATCTGKTVLNTFAYTCAFGVAAAAAGASTTNVDLSRNYLEWGRQNYLANQIESARHEFIYGDVFDWLKRFAKKGRHFDLIILDPPTFSRDRQGNVFQAERDYGELLDLALSVAARNGQLLCCVNTHRLRHPRFAKILQAKLPKDAKMTPIGMPEDFPGSDYLKSIWVEQLR